MTPGRQFHFRMPEPMAVKLDAIKSAFPVLPTPVLMRLLLSATLNRPMAAQVKAIQSEIRRQPESRTKGEIENVPTIATGRRH